MAGLNTTELADRLSVSKPRVSQWVSEGKLDGCYSGDGRNRRFDLDKVCSALGRSLHPGQMMGNGAATRSALKEAAATGETPSARKMIPDTGLPLNDPDRYELARIQKVEEEARRLRRQNMAEEGAWVLASEVQRQTARILSQEISQVENLLRDTARALADEFGLDFRSVRKVMMDQWRRYRQLRSDSLGARENATGLTDQENEANV
ncbi:MAG: hypothetical protein ACK5IP_22330 [Paracoccus sp. (in: a-proteobacteria)]